MSTKGFALDVFKCLLIYGKKFFPCNRNSIVNMLSARLMLRKVAMLRYFVVEDDHPNQTVALQRTVHLVYNTTVTLSYSIYYFLYDTYLPSDAYLPLERFASQPLAFFLGLRASILFLLNSMS